MKDIIKYFVTDFEKIQYSTSTEEILFKSYTLEYINIKNISISIDDNDPILHLYIDGEKILALEIKTFMGLFSEEEINGIRCFKPSNKGNYNVMIDLDNILVKNNLSIQLSRGSGTENFAIEGVIISYFKEIE